MKRIVSYALAYKEYVMRVMIEVYRSCIGVSEEGLTTLMAIAMKDSENRNRGALDYLIKSRENLQSQIHTVEAITVPSQIDLQSDCEGTIKRCITDI